MNVFGRLGFDQRHAHLEEDVEREFEQHLEERAAFFLAEGLSEDDARTRALEVFGDPESAKTACMNEALVDRWRASRKAVGAALTLSCVLMVLTFGAAAFAFVQTARHERAEVLARSTQQALAAQSLELTELEALVAGSRAEADRARADLVEARRQALPERSQALGMVVVRGQVRREGVWFFPRGSEPDLGELLTRVGISPDAEGAVTLTQRLGQDAPRTIEIASVAQAESNEAMNTVLQGDCEIVVR